MLTQQEVTAERVVFRQGLQNTLVTLTTWGHGPILQVHTHNYTHTHTHKHTHTLHWLYCDINTSNKKHMYNLFSKMLLSKET